MSDISNIVSAVAAVAAATVSVIAAFIAYRGLGFTEDANNRAKILFEAQNAPVVQIRPLKFIPRQPNESGGTTILEINNPSIADAYEVDVDLKYGGNWIKDWIKAKIKSLEQKGDNRTLQDEAELHHYRSTALSPTHLRAGQFLFRLFSGAVEADLCEQAKQGNEYKVQVKATWRDKDKGGEFFSTLIEYELTCIKVNGTEDYTFGRSKILS